VVTASHKRCREIKGGKNQVVKWRRELKAKEIRDMVGDLSLKECIPGGRWRFKTWGEREPKRE